jgi:NAD(P)-dependent dehydrogenase (short-subunit alcohol dehydrogenase family)
MAAAALRARHAGLSLVGRSAVVAGGTSGIGEGIALRLASLGARVTILGRDAARGAAVVAEMRARGAAAGSAHVPVDAFSLRALSDFSNAYARDNDALDVLVMSQGMATLQGFTPTVDGLDEKLTLHYFGRVQLVLGLLPLLRRAAQPTVISVLSAGVHSGVADWAKDPALEASYSIKRAADTAGFYNDLAADALARAPGNERILFCHAAPGFVATRWGTEMPAPVRWLVRGLQVFGKSAADCAEAMLDPLFERLGAGAGVAGGWRLIGEHGQTVPPTREHTDAVREGVWDFTVKRLGAFN